MSKPTTKIKRQPRTALDRQTKEVMKLLVLWPSAPSKAIEQYIQDTLGVKVTRVCIQEAKKEMGLHEPKHERKTLEKRAFTKLCIVGIVSSHGIGVKETLAVKRTEHALEEHFGEKTNHRLVQSWTREFLGDMKGVEISQYRELHQEAEGELRKMRIHQAKRQGDLL